MPAALFVEPAVPSLSSNDASVLQAVFDTESSLSSAVKTDISLPPLPNISASAFSSLQKLEIEAIRPLQRPNPSRDIIETAISKLSEIISQNPTYASAYVNRAQTLRMLLDEGREGTGEENGEGFDHKKSDDNEDIFALANTGTLNRVISDLGRAIDTATPSLPTSPFSPAQARILADAHTHRGYLLLKAAKRRNDGTNAAEGPEPGPLRGAERDQLEDMASRDFYMGGRYGNKIAHQMSVQTNPYAKMCGAIVKEALMKEMEGGTMS